MPNQRRKTCRGRNHGIQHTGIPVRLIKPISLLRQDRQPPTICHFGTELNSTRNSGKNYVLVGAIVCCTAVALGAFGAHALKGVINDWYDVETAARKLASWETGIRYQMFHGLAFLCLAALVNQVNRPRFLKLAAIFFTCGIVIFSGGLYLWVLTDITPFVITVPVGGFAYIIGWACLAISSTGHSHFEDSNSNQG